MYLTSILWNFTTALIILRFGIQAQNRDLWRDVALDRKKLPRCVLPSSGLTCPFWHRNPCRRREHILKCVSQHNFHLLYIPVCNIITQLWKVGAIYISSFAVNLVGWRCIWFVSNVINSDGILNRQWRTLADPLEGIGHLPANKLLWGHSAPLQSPKLSSSRHLGIFIRHSLIVNTQGSFLVYL